MVELVDTPDLGSGVERRVGSSPTIGTKLHNAAFYNRVRRKRK